MKLWKILLISFPIALVILVITGVTGMQINKKGKDKTTTIVTTRKDTTIHSTTEEELIDYSITYILDGGTNSINNPTIYNKKTNEIILDSATKIGFDFLGWYKENSFVNKVKKIPTGSTGDITLYAKYELANYTITYELDGGTNSQNNQETYNMNSNDIVLEDPTKNEYKFIGWYKENTFENKVESIPTGSTGNITLYAKFEIINYNINYILDGGINNELNPNTYNIESNEIVLENPTKVGYNFLGWFTKSTFDSSSKVEKIETGSTGDLTLYAKFSKDEYSITYIDTLDATNSNPTSYNVETETFTLTNLSKNGYTFLGWSDEVTTTPTLEYTIEKGSTGNKTIKANFKANTYNLTYELYGKGDNSSENVLTFDFNSFITLYAPTPHDGYIFDSWYVFPDFDNPIYRVNCGLQKMNIPMDFNYYAHFISIDYTITYVLNGGENASSNPSGYIVSEDTIVLADATKKGYNFIGWYTTNTFDEESKVEKIETGSTGDMTLYAKFVIIDYNINYELDGGTNGANPDTYTVLDEITLADASKDNYRFVGWYTTETFVEESRITNIEIGTIGEINIYAKFIGYSLTTSIDNVESGSVTPYDNVYFAAGETVNLTITLNDYYSFIGWFVGDECISTNESFAYTITKNDVSIIAKTAKFSLYIHQALNNDFEGSYLVTYESNGGTYYYPEFSNNLVYKVPTKEGYEFVGWYDNSEFNGDAFDFTSQITKDITLYAKWVEQDPDMQYLVYNKTAVKYYTKGANFSDYIKFTAFMDGKIKLYARFPFQDTTATVELYDGNMALIESFTIYDYWEYSCKEYDAKAGDVFYVRVKTDRLWYGYQNMYATMYFNHDLPNTGYTFAETTRYDNGYFKADNTLKLTATTKNGTTFIGWYVNDVLVSTDKTYTFTMPHENVMIYAKYEYFTLTVNRNINEAGTVSNYNNSKVEAGKSITLEATVNDGYAFTGWYLNNQLVGSNLKYTFTMTNTDLVYEARFSEVVVELTKTIEEAGTVSISKNLILGESATITATVNYGYIFIGWYLNNEQVATTLSYEITVELENRYEARYIINGINISNYLDESGSISNYKFGYLLNQELELTFTIKDGYTWYGWYLDNDLLSTDKTITIIITDEEHSYVAKTEKYVLSVTPNLTDCCRDYAIITYDSKGGSEITPQKSYDIKYPIPTKDDAVFAGWYFDEEYTSEFKFDQVIEDDITLYAKWVDVDCTVLPLNKGIVKHLPTGNYDDEPAWVCFYPLTSGEVTFNIYLSYYGYKVKVYDSDKETIIKTYEYATTERGQLHLKIEVEAYKVYYIKAAQYYINGYGRDTDWSITANLYDIKCQTSRNNDIIVAGENVKLFTTPNIGYTFNGWYLNDELVSSNCYYSFTMPESSITFEPRFSKNKTTYTVNHLKEDLDGNYENEPSVELEGYTSDLTEAVANTYTGFTVQEFSQLSINGDGSTVINIYYKRNVNSLTVSITNTINDSIPATVDISSGSYKFDEEITLTLTIKDGYNFIGWYDGELQVSIDLVYTFNMPNNNVDLEAKFESKSVEYTVEYWLENANDDDYTIDNEATETLSGYVGNQTEAVAKTYDWFNTPTVNQTTISATGTIIRINYTRKTVNEVRIGINIDRNESNGKYGRINCPESFWNLEMGDMNTGITKYLVHNDNGIKYGFSMLVTANLEDGYSLEGLYINGVKLDSFTYEVNPNDANEYGLIVIVVRVNVRYSIHYYYQNNINEWIADNSIDITYDEDSSVDYAWIKEGTLSSITSESDLNIKDGYEFISAENKTINNKDAIVKVYCNNKKYSFEHIRNNGYYGFYATLYDGSNIFGVIELYYGQTINLSVTDGNQENVRFVGLFAVDECGTEEEIVYTIDNDKYVATFNMLASNCKVYARFVLAAQIEFYKDDELVKTDTIDLVCKEYYNFINYKNEYEGYTFIKSTVQENSNEPFVINERSASGYGYYYHYIPENGIIVVRIYYEVNE